MARVHHIKKCRKSPGDCGGCHRQINVGEPYQWVQPGFRGRKKFRCGLCRFKPSDMTDNDKLGRVLSATETAEDDITAWDGEDIEELKSILQTAADEIKEVAEEYRESAENIRNIADNSIAQECEEKADSLDSWAEEMESALDGLDDRPEAPEDAAEEATPATEKQPEPSPGEEGEKPENVSEKQPEAQADNEAQEAIDAWIDEARSAASDIVGNNPL